MSNYLTINNKNLLQEYTQKHKLPFPIYDSCQVGTTISPEWQSTVILTNITDVNNNIKYTGDKFPRKTTAENSAAWYALKALENMNISNISPVIYDVNTAILIDIENLPRFFEEIPEQDLLNENLTVYGFVGQYHPLYLKFTNEHLVKIASPSTRQDGTDTCIQVYTGMLLALEKHEHYIIATKDHFGSSLVEMISNPNLGWAAKTAQLAISYKQI